MPIPFTLKSASDREAERSIGGLATALFELGRLFLKMSPRDLSLTASSTLVVLVDQGPLRITALAEREGVTQPSMSELVNRLQASGLVTRMRDPQDGRAVKVAATSAGVAVVDERRRARAQRFAELVRLLEPAELQALAAAEPAIRRIIESGNAQLDGAL